MSDELVRLPAAIVNLSHNGAMLELTNRAALTGSVTLLFEHTMQPCTLVWQQASLAGVRFVELAPPADSDC
ncbi:MAG: hypothetical protein L0H19_04905 [Salinisphaera sp.]|nr:hypothetical protein [Salinisphaera sp.]